MTKRFALGFKGVAGDDLDHRVLDAIRVAHGHVDACGTHLPTQWRDIDCTIPKLAAPEFVGEMQRLGVEIEEMS